jgi:uncharacterized DUF497 family protein
VEFEWDSSKCKSNLTKHAVSFDEAKTVFEDPFYIDFFDPDHSDDEQRYIIFGMSKQGRLLVVSYTERDDKVRMISVRKATRSERGSYEER